MKYPSLKSGGTSLRRVENICRDLNTLCSLTSKPSAPTKAHRQCKGEIVRSNKRARYALEPLQASLGSAYSQTSDDTEDSEELKAQLLDSLYGLERGFKASGEIKGEISELILKLEAINPTPEPNQALDLLNGVWRLVYTANSELLALLALNELPGVRVGDIVQEVERGLSVSNKVILSGLMLETSFSAKAALEVSSPKRLGVRFEEGAIATPTIVDGLDFPNSLPVLGQPIDLTRLKEALEPVLESFRDAAQQVSAFLGRNRDLKFPIRGPQTSSWLLNTYLDKDLRISRGDGGSVFVLVKE